MQYCVRFWNFISYFKSSRYFKTEKKDHNSESVCVCVCVCVWLQHFSYETEEVSRWCVVVCSGCSADTSVWTRCNWHHFHTSLHEASGLLWHWRLKSASQHDSGQKNQSVFSLFVEDLGARIWLFGSLPEEKWTLFDSKTCYCGPLLYLCIMGFKMNIYIWEKSFSYLQVPHFILKWLEGRRVPAAQRRNVTFTETHVNIWLNEVKTIEI